MKTKLFILLVLALINSALKSQAPDWQWAKQGGGRLFDEGFSIAADAGGNVYAIGAFASPAFTLGNLVLINADSSGNTFDIFIVKYDASGNVLWAKAVGGKGNDFGNSACTDANGNLIVSGAFSGSLSFGISTLYSSGGYDLFIVKYDALGNALWSKKSGGTGDDIGNCVCVDGSGAVVVAGEFYSPAITFGNTTLANSDGINYSSDFLIAKYDSSGNVLWANRGGGPGPDAGTSICADAAGNVIAAGEFSGSSHTFGADTLNGFGSKDVFIVKYTTSGNLVWATSGGGVSADVMGGLSCNALGEIAVTGSFKSPSLQVVPASGSGNYTLQNNDTLTNDIFIVKYTPSGKILWARSSGGSSEAVSTGIVQNPGGEILLTGYFGYSSLAFATNTLYSVGSFDGFVAKYDSSGNATRSRSLGGSSEDMVNGICLNAAGEIFITGTFQSPAINFGNTTLMNASDTVSVGDVFVAKLNANFTAIKKVSDTNPIRVYPNPFSMQAVLQLDFPLTNATLSVHNSLGQVVEQRGPITVAPGQAIAMYRENLPSGIYFVRLLQEGQVIATTKLIIED